MKIIIFLTVLFITGCAGSFYEAQSRLDAVEVVINGETIRVIDLGTKVEMIRKGYVQSGSVTERWEDFVQAGEQVTGCEIVNITQKPGTNSLTWVQALKKCKASR